MCPNEEVEIVTVKEPCVQAYTKYVRTRKPNCGGRLRSCTVREPKYDQPLSNLPLLFQRTQINIATIIIFICSLLQNGLLSDLQGGEPNETTYDDAMLPRLGAHPRPRGLPKTYVCVVGPDRFRVVLRAKRRPRPANEQTPSVARLPARPRLPLYALLTCVITGHFDPCTARLNQLSSKGLVAGSVTPPIIVHIRHVQPTRRIKAKRFFSVSLRGPAISSPVPLPPPHGVDFRRSPPRAVVFSRRSLSRPSDVCR